LPEPVIIETHEFPDAVLLRIRGEVDLATASVLSNALTSALAGPRHVIVSVREVRYMDLAGFHALDAAQKATMSGCYRGRKLALVASPPHLEKVIQIIQFDRIMPVFGSEEQALAFVRTHRLPEQTR
jgi:anti-sigma B factor antagonist